MILFHVQRNPKMSGEGFMIRKCLAKLKNILRTMTGEEGKGVKFTFFFVNIVGSTIKGLFHLKSWWGDV